MRIQTACPACGKRFRVNETLAGKRARCKACNERFVVEPAPSAETQSRQPSMEITSGETLDSSRPNAVSGESQTLGRLDHFELKEVVGSGAFGVVYRAIDTKLGRQVAIKVPRFNVQDEGKLRRFLTEARTAARLRHPNIVALYASGKSGNGTMYLVSEFVEGRPLSAYVAENTLDLQTKVCWLRDLALALDYAHSEGIIHRDIKTENVLVDEIHQRPQLTDFGLAKQIDEISSIQTQDGSLLGTPAYMAPEQARGELDQVGPKSDQYSLGVVMYELITGERPYRGRPHEVIAAICTDNPSPTVLDAVPAMDPHLNAICAKAMSKSSDARYESASELAEDLNRWLNGTRPIAVPVAPPRRRQRFGAPEGVLVVSVMILIVAGSFLLWRNRGVPESAMGTQPTTSASMVPDEPAESAPQPALAKAAPVQPDGATVPEMPEPSEPETVHEPAPQPLPHPVRTEATTLVVGTGPDEYPTIDAAIANAISGDVVEVRTPRQLLTTTPGVKLTGTPEAPFRLTIRAAAGVTPRLILMDRGTWVSARDAWLTFEGLEFEMQVSAGDRAGGMDLSTTTRSRIQFHGCTFDMRVGGHGNSVVSTRDELSQVEFRDCIARTRWSANLVYARSGSRTQCRFENCLTLGNGKLVMCDRPRDSQEVDIDVTMRQMTCLNNCLLLLLGGDDRETYGKTSVHLDVEDCFTLCKWLLRSNAMRSDDWADEFRSCVTWSGRGNLLGATELVSLGDATYWKSSSEKVAVPSEISAWNRYWGTAVEQQSSTFVPPRSFAAAWREISTFGNGPLDELDRASLASRCGIEQTIASTVGCDITRLPGAAPSNVPQNMVADPPAESLDTRLDRLEDALERATTSKNAPAVQRVKDELKALPEQHPRVSELIARVDTVTAQFEPTSLTPQERQARQLVERAIARRQTGDEFGAFVLQRGVPDELKQTAAWQKRQGELLPLKEGEKRFALSTNPNYLHASPATETADPETLKESVAHLYRNRNALRIGAVRIFLEDESLDSTFGVRIVEKPAGQRGGFGLTGGGQVAGSLWYQGFDERYYGGARSSIRNLGSGETVYAYDTGREENAFLRIESLRHRTTDIRLPLQDSDDVYSGAIVIRKAPPSQLGQLLIRLAPEPGLDPTETATSAVAVTLASTEASETVTVPLNSARTLRRLQLNPGTYSVRVLSGSEFASSGFIENIQVPRGRTVSRDVPVFRHRQVRFEWRFRESDQGPWESGNFTAEPQSDDFVDIPLKKHIEDLPATTVMRLYHWDGQRSRIALRGQYEIAPVAPKGWPPGESALDHPRRGIEEFDFDLRGGETFALWNSPGRDEFEVVLHVKEITVP
ncbi:Serine/threonine-protein kinase PknB [Maioricimonas rarisocia]|uniref:Serine/threonine-protein kinase PknB n=1 Tax=Maioricimonas rarisocia TaxID=2528026 RepID=A0A517ZAR9_9PLAN|nr:serine/threonine-protein kinase [Maioricimonas rarisocia]QDU39547.1 Serine/threonine-protein kinase PknB [Maioricimonas rarisocia]